MTNSAASKSYDIRSRQTKTLAVRIVQGYEITKTKCTHCGIPLMEYKGNVSCVICPKLEDTTDEGGEDGGVEIINNMLSGSILGSMSSSRESLGDQSFEEVDNSRISNAEVMTPSYSIESEVEYLPSDGADSFVEEPLATSPAESVAEPEPESEAEPKQTTTPPDSEAKMTALPDSEAKKNDNTKNVLFMKKIEEMAQMKKKKEEELKEHFAFNDIHVRFSSEPSALRSPVNARNNASAIEPMRAYVSPKAATKRVGINNIAGDGSAKKSYMPAWESKMNSASEGDVEGKLIKPAGSAAVAKTSDECRDNDFFTELRQRAANKPKVGPFAVEKADNFRKVDSLPMYGNGYTGNHATGHLRQNVATPQNVERKKDVDETEFTERRRRAIPREKEEKKLMESMSNRGKINQPISSVPLDEMKALTVKCMKEERVLEPFDENKAKSRAPETFDENKTETPATSTNEEADKETAESEEIAESMLSNKDKLLKSTNEVLASINEALDETKLHLSKEKKSNQSDAEKVPSTNEVIGDVKLHSSKEKKQNQSGTGDVSSSSDSIADSLKQHSQRIVALEAKTLQKYTNAVLATTNPNPSSSASVASLSTAEKDKRQLLRGRVLKLEAEALRKHSEAAKAALHARQALDKMMENRKKKSIDKENTVERKQAKIEDLSISSSLSTKDETASHPSISVESASLSQYSGYEYSRTGDDASREEVTIRTPPNDRRFRSTSRDMNPPELNIGRTHSSRYHREQREHARSLSAPRRRMPPNIMLPSLHSASPRHHASPRHNRDRSSRPHLMPYSPRSTPRKSSKSSQRPFANRPQSPSLGLHRNGASSNLDHSTPAPCKYRGSMTPRTVHEQQHFDFHQNQAPSRNFESMMLASDQTVQERVMHQQQPRVMQRSVLDSSIHHNSQEQEQMMMNSRYLVPEQPRMVVQEQPRTVLVEQPRMVIPEQPRMVIPEQPRMVIQEQPRMVVPEQPRMVVTEQPRIAAPQQMVQLQHPSVDFPAAAYHDPATQYSHLNSAKVRVTHPRDGAVSNIQYVNPNAYVLDKRNDYSSMRYDGTLTRW